MRLESALVSGASEDWTFEGRRTKACGAARWRAQRDLAYALAGIKHVPAHEPKRAKVSVIWKGPSERQRLFIGQDVLDLIGNRFPDIDLEMHDVMRESAAAQMAWLARTSILITNIGSPSYRLMYLPDGAQARRCSACVPCLQVSAARIYMVCLPWLCAVIGVGACRSSTSAR